MDPILSDGRARAGGALGPAGDAEESSATGVAVPPSVLPPATTAKDASTGKKATLENELHRLGDLLDRVERHPRKPRHPASGTHRHPHHHKPLPATDRAAAESVANALERTRLGAPARSAGKDPTQLPSAAQIQKSMAAIADAGFTNVHLKPVPYLNQGDPAWAAHPYPKSPPVPGESRTIQQAGCAPTALAMIDCGLRDAHTSPIATAKFAVKHGFSGTPGGSGTKTSDLARTWAHESGLVTISAASSDQGKNVDALKTGLAANGLALVSVGPDPASGRAHFGTSSHVVVINGFAERNGMDWFSVADPGRSNQARPHADLLGTDETVTRVSGAANGIGQLWISRTQLEAEMRRAYIVGPGVRSADARRLGHCFALMAAASIRRGIGGRDGARHPSLGRRTGYVNSYFMWRRKWKAPVATGGQTPPDRRNLPWREDRLRVRERTGNRAGTGRNFATGGALACYLGNYLGCFDGEWLASRCPTRYRPAGLPFKRSKVTIVEQTADRVVAEVGEVVYTEVFQGVPMVSQGEDELSRPFTDAEIAAVKDWSRYTIVKGKDGVWRISDRKTSYGWFCDFLKKRPH